MNKSKWVHWDEKWACLVYECPECGHKEKAKA